LELEERFVDEYALLEDFVVGNRDLEHLERLLNEFNIFEALGAVRQELRHSDFLAFLLDPYQNHGLGDDFLKRFLKRVLFGAPEQEVTPVEVDVADLSNAFVRREWHNIDILIRDPRARIVCTIENKVTSGEHSDQLKRYRKAVTRKFPEYSRIFVFLTPEGDAPSDEAYLPYSYGEIAELVDAVRQARASTLGADVRTLMTHYTTMLRRHIVSDSEIAELCRKLYREHQQALDLIYEHRPDLQYDLFEMLKQLVEEAGPGHDLSLDHSTKSYIRFSVADWDRFAAQRAGAGEGWVDSGRVLVFEFDNRSDQLSLKLIIGPGPQPVRKGIHEALKARSDLFDQVGGSTYTQFKTVYKTLLLTSRDYEESDWEMLESKVRQRWQQFLDGDLPEIRRAVDKIHWDELATS
jgi:thiamine phosphate synthase YjbQ (UPF0047 family)